MEPHQVPWLFASKYKQVSYKIPDVGFDRKPCDMVFFSGAQAYVGIIFYVPRKKKTICLIDVDDFIGFFKDNVSISEEQAITLARYHGSL